MREKNTAVRKQGLDFNYVKDAVMKNVTFCGTEGDEVILNGVESFKRE